MRTLLSQFCESFDGIVRPLLEPLTGAAQALLEASPDMPGKQVRAELLDLRHQLEGLVDKVAEQQAYVLLFGPLKSGKSTLMNALAGTYVSEVSSLPAYPCMVYLSHSSSKQFDVTRYNGKAERFSDPSALYMHINRAHGDLAARIREAEDRGEAFDPALHYPDAIRKVDVRLPAGDLEQSGAVLVDTPGLYSRMKFGYDRMTREFRDAASCAIFIVKSDNLFLEQVFEEFEDLLDLFSRIFLVVNLDTTKSDLTPDGTLVPSLEQEDPLRIIDAFENLAMSAPLKDAADEGRLRIYPVDLLRAASNRLKGIDRSEHQARGQANFDAFLRDLTEYLNSTDYLVAFLGDSLKRAGTLLDDTTAILEHPQVETLRKQTDELDNARQDAQRRRHAVKRLLDHEWRVAFDELDQRLAPAIREKARRASEETERALDAVLDRWFGSEESLQTLVGERLVPALREYQEQLNGYVQGTLDDEVLAGTAGILLPTDVAADLYAAGVDLNLIGKQCLARIDKQTLLRSISTPLTTGQIPIRRSLLDWLFLRGPAKVRARLFGAPEAPSLRVPIDVKNSRIGREGKEAIRRELDLYKGRFFHETVQHVHRHVVGQYAKAAVDALVDALHDRDRALDGQLEAVIGKLMEHRKVLAHLATLKASSERAAQGIDELSVEYGGTEPEMLIQPAPAPAGNRPLVPPSGTPGAAHLGQRVEHEEFALGAED
jgi:energy-coupling factor transporter ATP-binding protein EcfA2